MMEAIAALSLACNILQLVDSGAEAIKIIQQAYRDGFTKDNDRIGQASKQLGDLSSELENSLQRNASVTPPSKVAIELKNIASSCQKNAKKLRERLDKLQGTKSGVGAIWRGVKTSWKKSEIEKMVKELRDDERRLETCMLLYINESNKTHEAIQTQEFQKLNEKFRQLTQSLITQAQVSTLVKDDGDITRQTIVNSQSQMQQDLTAKFDTLNSQSLQSRILQSLAYPGMNDRISQIHEAEDQTFKWIYDETLEDGHRISRIDEADDQTFEWTNDGTLQAKRCALSSEFRNWLATGQGIYWINGKAGSGKSTLMKFIWQHHQTVRLLCQNTDHQTPPLVLRFSLWLSGSVMQKTLKGMLCSLLYQILSIDDRVAVSCITAQHGSYWTTKKEPTDWSLRELDQVLLSALQFQSANQSTLICLDGLDELDPMTDRDPNVLLKIIQSWSNIENVKVCASSRPEAFWLKSFSNSLQFRLQDLTEIDIKIYVSKKLDRATFDGLLPVNHHARDDLVDLITRKAEGVFLWVYLVVHRVLQGLMKFANWDELMTRVFKLPSDMASLYQNMLERASQEYEDYETVREEASMWLKVCLINAETLSINGFIPLSIHHCIMLQKMSARILFTNIQINDIDFLQADAKRLVTRIPAICAGMVELAPHTNPSHMALGLLIDTSDIFYQQTYPLFLHRTVRDFLTDIDAGKGLMRHAKVNAFQILCSLVCGDMAIYAHTAEEDRLEILDGVFARLNVVWSQMTQLFQEQIDDVSFVTICEYVHSQLYSLAKSLTPTVEAQVSTTELVHTKQQNFFDWCRLSRKQSVWLDFMGLSLQHNCDTYFMEKLGAVIRQPRSSSSGAISQEYLDYLLLCACAGSCNVSMPRESASMEALNLLFAAGANPNTIFYLPLGHPRPRSAKSAVLVHLLEDFLLPSLEKLDWDLFFDKAVVPEDAHMFYYGTPININSYAEFEPGDLFSPREVFEPGDIPEPELPMTILELNIQAFLRQLWSTYKTSGYRGMANLIGFSKEAGVPIWGAYVTRVVLVPGSTIFDEMSGLQLSLECLNQEAGILSDANAVSFFQDLCQFSNFHDTWESFIYVQSKFQSVLDDPSTTKARPREFFQQYGYYYDYQLSGHRDSRVLSAPIEMLEPQNIDIEIG